MFKAVLLITILCTGGYFYYSSDESTDDLEAEGMVSDEEAETSQKKTNILAEKNLHEAFEKILEKKEQERLEEARKIASEEEAVEETPPDEVIDSYTYNNNLSEEEYAQEYDNMNDMQKENSIKQLQFEISSDTKLIEQMETDQKQGLNITDNDIAAVTQRTENKKYKLEAYIMRRDAHKE
jgi:hypothetical protein